MADLFMPQFGHSVFYAYIISINGQEVGSIQKLNIKGARDSSRIGEVKYQAEGLKWKEILWGYESVTLDLSHIEFYHTSFIQAIGADVGYVSLSKFNFAFEINEFQYGQAGSAVQPGDKPYIIGNNGTQPSDAAGLLRTITYNRCVPTSYSKTIDRGTIHVVEDMTVECTNVTLGSPDVASAGTGS